MLDLAEVHCAQGVYAQAEILLAAARGEYAKIFGMNHRSTLEVAHSLADVLRYQGKFEPARVLCEAVLEHRRLYYGEKHPNTMQAINNLAHCYDGLGMQDEATKLIFDNSKQLTTTVEGGNYEMQGAFV